MAELESSGFMSSLKKNPSLNVENAVEALMGSEDLYEKLVRLIVSLIPSRIDDMDGILKDDGDLSAFSIRIHGIKGSLMQMGCRDLAMVAESLEQAAKAGDRQYCTGRYQNFKERLLLFHGEITSLLPDTRTAGIADSITDYYDTLCLARKKAEEYDSISAAESISQLTCLRFGENVDVLIFEAARALELFRPEKALEYIVELINICEADNTERGE